MSPAIQAGTARIRINGIASVFQARARAHLQPQRLYQLSHHPLLPLPAQQVLAALLLPALFLVLVEPAS